MSPPKAAALQQNRLSENLIERAITQEVNSNAGTSPSVIRKEPVTYALEHGNKATAKECKNTVKTVRKSRKRSDEHRSVQLKDKSKKQKNSPRIMTNCWLFAIAAIAKQAITDNTRINGGS